MSRSAAVSQYGSDTTTTLGQPSGTTPASTGVLPLTGVDVIGLGAMGALLLTIGILGRAAMKRSA